MGVNSAIIVLRTGQTDQEGHGKFWVLDIDLKIGKQLIVNR